MTETILAWHFLSDDGTMRDGTSVTAGETYRVVSEIVLCECGFHASINPRDALKDAPGAMICRVEMGGNIIQGTDKLVASECTVLWMADATRILHEFACWCAEQALLNLREHGIEIDPRSWAAIEAKRQWLHGAISDSELDAARDAAGAASRAAALDAAEAAAGAASRAAALDAAEAAAWAAARAAALDAAGAASRAAALDAAWDAAWAAQSEKLENMLTELSEDKS